ncbi:viperin family antiviral radical SAM protein [Oceanospirillum sp.]|uniref:viperin family antiviral radical SAM protein n=1 Tax=Oceanospirillum sp. TaxID=2021254 RepID=UPI003A930754
MSQSNELVINFHMTEHCNYRCEYCYATWNADCHSKELHRQEGAVQSLIDKLSEYFFNSNPLMDAMGYKTVRLNIAGGEPMLLGKRFSDALFYAKKKGFRTSIITNAAFLDDETLLSVAPQLDVLGVSFDSADELIAKNIGRMDRNGSWISSDKLAHIASMYRELNPLGIFKVNTVVNQHNLYESLGQTIELVKPDKWKLLRVLPVYEDIRPVDDDEFQNYVERHSPFSDVTVVEDNSDMTASYLMINPEGRFYQNGAEQEGYIVSEPLLDVGVEAAFSEIKFNIATFLSRYA